MRSKLNIPAFILIILFKHNIINAQEHLKLEIETTGEQLELIKIENQENKKKVIPLIILFIDDSLSSFETKHLVDFSNKYPVNFIVWDIKANGLNEGLLKNFFFNYEGYNKSKVFAIFHKLENYSNISGITYLFAATANLYTDSTSCKNDNDFCGNIEYNLIKNVWGYLNKYQLYGSILTELNNEKKNLHTKYKIIHPGDRIEVSISSSYWHIPNSSMNTDDETKYFIDNNGINWILSIHYFMTHRYSLGISTGFGFKKDLPEMDLSSIYGNNNQDFEGGGSLIIPLYLTSRYFLLNEKQINPYVSGSIGMISVKGIRMKMSGMDMDQNSTYNATMYYKLNMGLNYQITYRTKIHFEIGYNFSNNFNNEKLNLENFNGLDIGLGIGFMFF